MTLLELQAKLGEEIELITDKKTPFEARRKLAEVSQTVSSLAKQTINLADVVLRAEKLVAEGKLQESAIEAMIGKAFKNKE